MTPYPARDESRQDILAGVRQRQHHRTGDGDREHPLKQAEASSLFLDPAGHTRVNAAGEFNGAVSRILFSWDLLSRGCGRSTPKVSGVGLIAPLFELSP